MNKLLLCLSKCFIITLLSSLLLFSCSEKNEENEENLPPLPQMSLKIPSELIINKIREDWISHVMHYEIENPTSENLKVTWSSDDPTIVTVDDETHIISIHNYGITNVTGTIEGTNISAVCKIIAVDAYEYMFRLTLRDKGNSDFQKSNPDQFLSPLAIKKRAQRNIAIDEFDFPISKDYINAIKKRGGVIVSKSKWLNTVTIYCAEEAHLQKYLDLPFVEKAEMVWIDNKDSNSLQKQNQDIQSRMLNTTEYGEAWDNININKGQILHQQGFRGEGIDIAVIDAGFGDLNTNTFLDNIKIKGVKSFIYEKPDIYEGSDGDEMESHGLWVTSCMATSKPNTYIGTAPEATYWLFRTEVSEYECPIEEDYLVAALEYADSVGVDIANISLSYSSFDAGLDNYTFEQMDGKTAFSTRGVNVAADKGMFIVNCAGNDQTWVGAPADSPRVLTAGNVRRDKEIGDFSSYGITVDGRMKPDVLALGTAAYVVQVYEYIGPRNGTSYSSPILCGQIACLWQAYPQLTNMELMDVIRKSGDRYNNPELPYGYGIADMEKAMGLAKKIQYSNNQK